MIRLEIFTVTLLVTFVGSSGFADWPPPELSGVWRVVSTSEDNKPDVLKCERLLLLVKDQFALIEGVTELDGLPPSAHSWDLSNGKSDGASFQSRVHTPNVTVRRNGATQRGIVKDPIMFLIEDTTDGPRQLTVKLPDMNLKAERLDQQRGRKTIGLHLANPDFYCPINLRKVLKEYIALSDRTQADEP